MAFVLVVGDAGVGGGGLGMFLVVRGIVVPLPLLCADDVAACSASELVAAAEEEVSSPLPSSSHDSARAAAAAVVGFVRILGA